MNVSQVFIGDEIKIGQMLGHVMQYAMDSTREGAVLVTAEMRGEEAEGTDDTGLLVLRIKYTGQMLSENRLRTSTAKPETISTEKLIGSNLGLAVSQNLAILMHGRIQVTSLQGDETEFQITLPRVDIGTCHKLQVCSSV